MLIENKLKRKGGSFVDMGDGTIYHFKDDGTGREVAAVTNPSHIARLLGITEAYSIPADQLAAMTQPAAAVGLPVTPAPVVSVAPVVPAPAPVVTEVPGDLPPPQGGADPGGTGAEQAQDAAASGQGAGVTDGGELTPETPIETIRAIYREEIGREPNANYKAATLIGQIEAARKAKS